MQPAPESFGELVQIIYCSRSLLHGTRAEISAEIFDIVAVSRRNNLRDQITGALFFNGRSFAQVLEGAPLAIANLYARLLRDKRHGDLCLMQHELITGRCFQGWAMAYFEGCEGQGFTISSGLLSDIVPNGERAGAIIELMRYVMMDR